MINLISFLSIFIPFIKAQYYGGGQPYAYGPSSNGYFNPPPAQYYPPPTSGYSGPHAPASYYNLPPNQYHLPHTNQYPNNQYYSSQYGPLSYKSAPVSPPTTSPPSTTTVTTLESDKKLPPSPKLSPEAESQLKERSQELKSEIYMEEAKLRKQLDYENLEKDFINREEDKINYLNAIVQNGGQRPPPIPLTHKVHKSHSFNTPIASSSYFTTPSTTINYDAPPSQYNYGFGPSSYHAKPPSPLADTPTNSYPSIPLASSFSGSQSVGNNDYLVNGGTRR